MLDHPIDLGVAAKEERCVLIVKGPHSRVRAGQTLRRRFRLTDELAQAGHLRLSRRLVRAVESHPKVDIKRERARSNEERDHANRLLGDAQVGREAPTELSPDVTKILR